MASETSQQTSSVVKYSALSSAHVNYLKAKTNKSGGKSVGIRLMVELPLMLTWGAQKYVDEVTGRVTYKMSLQFPRKEYSTPETDICLQKFIELENKLKEDATKNSMEWFNKPKDKMPPQVIDALFHPMLTWPKEPQTGERDMTKSPTLNVKLENYDGFNCEIYDVNNNMLFPDKENPDVTPLTLIPKAINIACVIQCGGIWFAGGKFGVTWKLFQCVVQPRPSLKGKCLISLSNEAKKEITKASVEDEPEQVVVSRSTAVEIVDDSDVEDEEPAEIKEKPKPAAPVEVVKPTAPVPATLAPATLAEPATPKVVKKVVRKKD